MGLNFPEAVETSLANWDNLSIGKRLGRKFLNFRAHDHKRSKNAFHSCPFVIYLVTFDWSV